MASSDRQVKIVVAADVAAAIRGLTQVSNAAGNVGGAATEAQSRTSGWVDAFKQGVGILGVQTGWDAVKAGFDKVIGAGLDFEASMNTLSAVTGANEGQMRSLSDRAKQLGNDITIPGASAGTAAAAMAELAKGGLTVNQSMTAAAGTLRLAAAAGIDGAEAAEIQANALNAFRLKADQADHVADLLANSSNAASGEITDMAAALKQSATVAAGFGISVDDSATTLALFAKNGVLGSDAGTSFKTMLSALASPTEAQASALETLNLKVYDSQGQFLGMESVTSQLAEAKKRLTVEEYNAAASTAFGTDAIRAANILGQEGVRGWDNMAEAVTKAGGAQELAAAQSQGLNGALDRFNNALENTALTIFESVQPALTGIADFGATAFTWLGDAIDWFTDLADPVRNAALALGAVVLLRGPLGGMLTSIAAQFRLVALASAGGALSFAGFAAAAKSAMAFVGGPIGLAIVGVTTALSFMGSATDDVAVSTADFSAAIDENTGLLKDNADAIIAKAAADSGSFDSIEAIGGSVTDYTQALLGNVDAQDRIHTLLLDQATAALRNSDAWDRMVSKGQVIPGQAREIASGLLAQGDAGQYASSEFDAVLLASANFAADSKNLTDAQRQTQQAIEAAGAAAGDAAGGVDDLAASTQKATEQTTPFADALKELRGAASEADAATQFLNISLLQLSGNAVPAEQLARANAAAFRDVGSATRDLAAANDTVVEKQAKLDEVAAHLGGTLNGQTITQREVDAAARELADAQAGVADATDKQKDSLDKAAESARTTTAEAYNNAVAQGNLKGATEAAVAKMVEQRAQFIGSAVDAGISREEAEKLADAQGLIPENVRTTYEQHGLDNAIARARDLNSELDKTNNRTVRYTVVGTEIYQYQTTSQGTANSAEGPGHADGGWVSGPGGPRDDMVAARLSPGEFVVNAAQARKNRGILEAINKGVLGFKDGGAVPGGAPAGDAETTTVSASLTAPDPAVFEKSWGAIVTATEAAWSGGISPVLADLSLTNTKTGEELTKLNEGMAQPAWQGISDAVSSSWNGTVNPTYAALNAGSQGVGFQQQMLRDQWAQAWQQNQTRTSDTTNWLTGVTFPTLNAGAQGVGAEQMNLAATTDAAWSQIGGKIQGTYEGQIVPAWTGVKSFADATAAFFAGIQAGVSGASGTVLSEIGKIRGAISSFMQLVGGSVPAAATGGSVAALLEAKADGGPITQGTGPRSDDVLIRVSKGEYVVNAAATARNRGALDAINFGGRTAPAFADGGAVGEKIRQPVERMIVDNSHKAIEAAIDKLVSSVGGFFSNGQWGPGTGGAGLAANTQAARDFIVKNWGITNIGGVYGGSVPGSDHPHGKALDVMIANYLSQAGIAQGDSVANWFINNPNSFGTKYVIWRDRINQGGSWSPYSHPGGNNDTLAHRDHVHLSFLTGAGAFSGSPVGDSGGGGSWLERMLAKISTGAPAGGAASYNAGAGVEQWRGLGMSVLQRVGQYVGQNLTPFIGHMLNQIRTESSGNPNAINRTDINAQRGDPSIGLLQVIGSTFRNALNGTPFAYLIGRGQRDPEASLVSSTLYSLRRYGSLDRAWRGVAYDGGGPLKPGYTLAYNGTGRDERILTGQQWAAAQSAIQHVTNHAARNTYQGGQHGGVHVEKIINNGGSDVTRQLAWAAVTAKAGV